MLPEIKVLNAWTHGEHFTIYELENNPVLLAQEDISEQVCEMQPGMDSKRGSIIRWPAKPEHFELAKAYYQGLLNRGITSVFEVKTKAVKEHRGGIRIALHDTLDEARAFCDRSADTLFLGG